MSSFPELLSTNHLVEALNDPSLPTFKYIALSFAILGIGMDIYNIVMYFLFQRVYLAPNPMVEKKGKSNYIWNIFGNLGQSLQEQQ